MRDIKAIEQEFSNLCAKAGHLQYQVAVLSEDLNLVNEEIKKLNFEAAKVHAATKEAEAEKAKEEAKS